MQLRMHAAVPLFLMAFVVVFGTVFLTVAMLANRIIPFGFGVFPAAGAALVLAFVGAQRAVRRVETSSRPSTPTLTDFAAVAIIMIVYFMASTAAALVIVIGVGGVTSVEAVYIPSLIGSAFIGMWAARFAAVSLLGVSRSWTLFAGAVASAAIVVLLASARGMSDWQALAVQAGIILIAGFWMLTPESAPRRVAN